MPAAAVPVAPQIGGVLGYDDVVAGPRFDEALAAGADVALPGGVGLNETDDVYPERAAHATKPAITIRVPTTRMMSTAVLRCSRKGFKPTTRW
jgi:hypothetical protein